MIRHTILFKVKQNAVSIEKAFVDFIALKKILPGIITIMGGKCHFNDEQVKEKTNSIFTHSISIDFVDERALQQFFNNPITHSAKDGIVNIVDGGYAGIIGFELSD